MCWLGLRLNIRRCWDLSRFLVQPSALPLHRGSRAALLRRRLRTAGYRRHRQSACRQASSRLPPKTLTTLQLAFGQLTARCVSAWKTPFRVIAKMTGTGPMPGEQAGHVACPPPSRLGAEPKRPQPPSHRPAGSALRPDHWNNRPSDRLQLLSWNPGPLRGLDPNLLASHLNGPRHVVCVQGGADFFHDKSLQDNFCIVTQHNCAVVLNKKPLHVCAALRPLQAQIFHVGCRGHGCCWQVPQSSRQVGLSLHGRQRSHHQRVRQADCNALFLLIRDLCLSLCSIVLTGVLRFFSCCPSQWLIMRHGLST